LRTNEEKFKTTVTSYEEFLMQTILVVDDDPNQRLLYEEELGYEGYHVLHAEGGREALEMVRKHHLHCVVLDLNMPDMDGTEVLRKIVESDLDLPVVINTAYAAYEDQLITGAADAYVVKSGDLTELKARVKDAMSKANASA
jgi:CheY-like chemotaxis protein